MKDKKKNIAEMIEILEIEEILNQEDKKEILKVINQEDKKDLLKDQQKDHIIKEMIEMILKGIKKKTMIMIVIKEKITIMIDIKKKIMITKGIKKEITTINTKETNSKKEMTDPKENTKNTTQTENFKNTTVQKNIIKEDKNNKKKST